MTEVRVVAGAVVRDGQVLVTRRGPTQHLAGHWELPGGKVEPGESDPVALVRELHEELGIVVEVGELLAESLHDYPRARVRLVAWHCRLLSGEPVLTEHDALVWLGVDALSNLTWAPADLPLLPAVAALLQRGRASSLELS
jgi:8-oxo-dGTP diphosphatase